MEVDKLTDLVTEALDDLKGQQITVLDVTGLTTMTDRMVIASGRSNRQVKSLADHVVARAKHAGVRPAGIEGEKEGEWILVDLGDVLVHVMQVQTRAFYQLEKLWDMPRLDAHADSDSNA